MLVQMFSAGSGLQESLDVSCCVVIVLVQGQVEDGLVAHLLPVVLVQVVVDLPGGLQGVSEASEVIVLQAPSQLALKHQTNQTSTARDRPGQLYCLS